VQMFLFGVLAPELVVRLILIKKKN
jgi:hypothetical protein